jgi:hypothetical protein
MAAGDRVGGVSVTPDPSASEDETCVGFAKTGFTASSTLLGCEYEPIQAATMSTAAPPFSDLCLPLADQDWLSRLPDGAVSIEVVGSQWVLRASHPMQARFEELLERRKSGQQTEAEDREYEALCDLDDLLSGFNRLARRVQQG